MNRPNTEKTGSIQKNRANTEKQGQYGKTGSIQKNRANTEKNRLNTEKQGKYRNVISGNLYTNIILKTNTFVSLCVNYIIFRGKNLF